MVKSLNIFLIILKVQKLTRLNLFKFLKSKGKRKYQTIYLGIDLFGDIDTILKNSSIYKIENYKQALKDFGVLDDVNKEVKLYNITKRSTYYDQLGCTSKID